MLNKINSTPINFSSLIETIINMIEKIAHNLESAREHWRNGHMGVTAADHWAIGGSPETELRRNPGKTLGELWSAEEILEKLENYAIFLERARKEHKEKNPHDPDIRWSRDDIFSVKEELRATIPYLNSIGKLPEKFKDFKVEDLESDPL